VKRKWVLMTEEIPSGEETATGEAETEVVAAVLEAATAAPEKCTRLPVLTAVLRLKFLSDQPKDGLYTAETAFLTTENSKDYSVEC
jgi:hypothetical protein